MSIKSLIINPGSTSTKLGIFEDETLVMDETLRHSTEEIAKYASIIDQKDFRKNIILDFLKEKNIDDKSFNVIVSYKQILAGKLKFAFGFLPKKINKVSFTAIQFP